MIAVGFLLYLDPDAPPPTTKFTCFSLADILSSHCSILGRGLVVPGAGCGLRQTVHLIHLCPMGPHPQWTLFSPCCFVPGVLFFERHIRFSTVTPLRFDMDPSLKCRALSAPPEQFVYSFLTHFPADMAGAELRSLDIVDISRPPPFLGLLWSI